MNISRRKFIKYSGILAGSATLSGTGLLSLKTISPEEAHAIQTNMDQYEKKYTACSMCPAECGLETWIKDGKLEKRI